MPRDSKHLRYRLQESGLSDATISAAWPGWWSDDAESSASAQVDLRFSLARKLGLDPRALLNNDEPMFVWKTEGKFKHLAGESVLDRSAISSYGMSIGRLLVAATSDGFSLEDFDPTKLRESILKRHKYVELSNLLGLCWAAGVPVIHLRLFPLSAKRMCAMAVRIGDRFAILLAKDAQYPPAVGFYLAHELGHIALGHLVDGHAVVDLADPLETREEVDDEEQEADRYALTLLTGSEHPQVDTRTRHFRADQLAVNVRQTGPQVRIEPGTLALCFGYTTGDWRKANAAIKRIYAAPSPVWQSINGIAHGQIDWSALQDDLGFYLRAVIGIAEDD